MPNDPIDVVVVDLETTGLSAAYGDRICEIGIVSAQGKWVLDTYQTLVNPQRPISPGAARVNGLSDAEVSQAPLFAEVASDVLSRINQAILVCHNAGFDLGFLDAELARLKLPWQPAGVIDTLEIARRFYHFSSNSLGAVAERLGIETPQAHRALGDALTTFKVFHCFYSELTGSGSIGAADIIRSYRPTTLPPDDIVLPPEIREALEAKRAIFIKYIDGNGRETGRVVTPKHVRETNGVLYLVSFCHMRQEERSFRLDRIIEIGKLNS
jgi:DNA polymerase III subunit epsilon